MNSLEEKVMKRICMAWVVVLSLLLAANAQAAAPLESRIPGDAILYVGWRGAEALGPQYEKSNLKGVVDNSKLRAYLVENFPKWLARGNPNDAEAMKRITDGIAGADLLWSKPMAFYMGPFAMEGQRGGGPTPRMAWLCDAGIDVAAVKSFAEKTVDAMHLPNELKAAVDVDEHVVIVTFGSADVSMFQSPATTIATAPAFTAATKGMRDDAAITAFYDVHEMFANIFGLFGPAMAAQAEQPLNTVGVSALTQIAFTAGFDGPQWREQTFIGIDGPKRGILTALDAPPITDDALRLVPKDAVAVSIQHIDLAQIWTAVRDVNGLNPMSLNAVDDSMAAAGKAAGFDIEKELIASLGNEWVVYSAPAVDDGTHPMVFVQKVKDPAAIAKVLAAAEKRINAAGAGKIKVEKLDTGKFEVTGVRLPQVTIAWALRGDYFYVSTPDGIQIAADHVETRGQPITANPDFAKVLAALPGDKPSSLSYSEPAKLYPQVYRLANDLLPLARLAGANIPGDLLPLPKKVAPFLTPGWSSAWSDTKGYHVVKCSAIPQADLLSGQIWGPTPIPVEILAFAGPHIITAQSQARAVKGMANMHQVSVMCFAYASQHNNGFPDHLGRLITSGDAKDGKLFVSPHTGTEPLKMIPELEAAAKNDFETFDKAFEEHCDYVYLGRSLTTNDDPTVIVFYEKAGPWSDGRISVMYLDGHIEQAKIDNLGETFKKTNESLKKRDQPEVDVEALQKAAAKN